MVSFDKFDKTKKVAIVKTLYVVRHAKSSWDDLSLSDFERPLNRRGKRDAPRMGKRLKEKKVVPDLMLSSPAKRALSTCEEIAHALEYPKEKIKTDRKLYHADEGSLLEVVRSLKDKHDVAFIFGHNPGLTDFVNALMNATIGNVPTCGIAACELDVETWQDVDWGMGKMLFFDFPKNVTR